MPGEVVVVTHVVLMKFKEPGREANVAEATRRLLDMVGKVESLRHLEVGLNFTDSPRACDLCLTTQFDDREGLSAYAVDPLHVTVKEFLAGVLESSHVVDYES